MRSPGPCPQRGGGPRSNSLVDHQARSRNTVLFLTRSLEAARFQVDRLAVELFLCRDASEFPKVACASISITEIVFHHIASSGKGKVSDDFSRSHSARRIIFFTRSEEHTSELQSLAYLVCRLLLEKKNMPTY